MRSCGWLVEQGGAEPHPDAFADVGRADARDRAIVAVLLHSGARVEECSRLEVRDVAVTARPGVVRLHGRAIKCARCRSRLLLGQRCWTPPPSAAAWTGRCG
ncbi:site-specific integrase [Actinomadura montaniterrae]|uniref:Site-specific integrase n=1 Tax=Actinomadura montaniterrae TaxID=1803903 RepID=A0A6L3VYG4_9ACTN|nr:site-specific integrase [Actinomadura montaniterrae]KAB2383668.1 site-specific integrase [Actinomadura montaniterrae]